MAEPDHHKQFQVAVDVIHNLPRNGCYRPSYEVMLRFYSLYKQALCGPCAVPQPPFWDPVGRYKWHAWSLLGEMTRESAMAAYVNEMKKVAQEVIDTVPMNEKTASLFHYFEPLYVVIDDMPRPLNSMLPVKEDSGVSDGVVSISYSDSEISCDSVEQLSNTKSPAEFVSSPAQCFHPQTCPEARQTGAGKGGEGAEDVRGPGSTRRSRDAGNEGSNHNWRECGFRQSMPIRANRGVPGGGGGAGRRGGDGSEDRAKRLHDAQLQQQIIRALQQLRENMKNVMDRLEVVERLSATYTSRTTVQASEWRLCQEYEAIASEQEVEKWWPFHSTGQTILLLLFWPFVAQGLVYLLRRAQRRSHISP
ncbi:acyl-CoA-binding domain-containing protein 4 isoform X2 [Genypterus blacodes]|uniref:acyl-CoA-binding domain-containing protein 4 isoform X2 n=1 Tax=Genypterus blacodes TaxID=154954 RepID=UPI003F7676DA